MHLIRPKSSFAALRDYPLREMCRLHASQGAFATCQDEGTAIWFVFGPEGNRPVLTETDLYRSCFCPVRGPRASAQRRLTSGLLSMNGQEHRGQRRMLAPPFLKPVLQSYTPAIEDYTSAMLRDWREGDVLDVRDEICRLVLRIASSLLFGINDVDLVDRCGEALDEFVLRNDQVGLMAVTGEADNAVYDTLLRTAEETEVVVRELIEARRAGQPGNDVLWLLIQAHTLGHVSDEQLLGNAALLYAAAKATTAHAIQWTLLLVAQHPEVWKRLRQELTADAGDDEVDAPDYLGRIIKESMRILPASAYVQRVTAAPAQLGPFDLPAGATVVFSQFVSHRIARYFPAPDRFRPDRWLGPPPPAYAYIPFGLGPRLCMGGPMAMHILKLVLPRIWRHCRLELEDDTTVDLQIVATLLTSADPLPMRVAAVDSPARRARLHGNINEFLAYD